MQLLQSLYHATGKAHPLGGGLAFRKRKLLDEELCEPDGQSSTSECEYEIEDEDWCPQLAEYTTEPQDFWNADTHLSCFHEVNKYSCIEPCLLLLVLASS